MYCRKCGTKLNHHDRFCFNCGTKVHPELEVNNDDEFDKNDENSGVEATASASKVEDKKVLPGREPVSVQIEKKDKFALLGFILSFFFVFGSIPSIIFSFLSLSRIKKNHTGGKSLAVTGLIISITALLIALLYLFSSISKGNGQSSGIV